ncbi:MAG: hypothetical protein IK081_10300 [Lachnospiraceae bacterium]|jgi:hypothetical protein|nr:hypothetical protein [Lachnospiraceae bacterium]
MAEADEKLIEEIMKHLDKEVSGGSMRMSVEMDDTQEEYAKVSHKCCKVYGKDSTRMVGELDMYSDLYLTDMKQRGELE